jgi:hypothetical protein
MALRQLHMIHWCYLLLYFGNVFIHYTREVMYVKCNIQTHWCNYRCSGKALRTAYSECVSVALVIQHVMRMNRVALSFVVRLALKKCFTLAHKLHEFGKIVLDTKYILVFSTNFV